MRSRATLENRLGRPQTGGHARRLRTLTGEEEGDARRIGGSHCPHRRARRELARRDRPQAVPHLPPIAGHHGQTMGEVRPAGVGRGAHVLQRQIGAGDEVVGIATGQGPEGALGAGRHGQQARRRGRLGRIGRSLRRRFEDHVGVRATEAEGADTGEAKLLPLPR